MDAEKRYHLLFNRITDALEALDEWNIGKAKKTLIQAQQDCENQLLSAGEKDGEEKK